MLVAAPFEPVFPNGTVAKATHAGLVRALVLACVEHHLKSEGSNGVTQQTFEGVTVVGRKLKLSGGVDAKEPHLQPARELQPDEEVILIVRGRVSKHSFEGDPGAKIRVETVTADEIYLAEATLTDPADVLQACRDERSGQGRLQVTVS